MKRLTIVPPNWHMSIDDQSMTFDFSQLVEDATITAIHWSAEALEGHIERNGNAEPITDPAAIWPFVTAFHHEAVKRASTALELAKHAREDAQIDLHDQRVRAQERAEKRAEAASNVVPLPSPAERLAVLENQLSALKQELATA